MTPEDLAVVIPSRGRPAILRRTLAALQDQRVAGFEVVVVIDGTDVAAPPDLAADRVIIQDHAGPGAARNRGVAATDRPLVLFLGDDMIPTRDLVAEHLAVHAARTEATVAVLGHVGWHPDIRRNRILSWLDWSTTQFDYARLAGHGGTDVGFGRFYSSNVSLKRSLFESVGGFDEDFVFYYEDLDLGWRLGEAGMALLYAPEAVAEHLHDYDLDAVRRRFAGIALGERLMAAKHDWFRPPYFHDRIHRAVEHRPVSRVWPRVVDLLPGGTRLRRRVERLADRWYHQQVADDFLAGWRQAAHLVELREYLGDRFDPAVFLHHERAVDEEAETVGDETTFYRSSHTYLYDLTVFAMSGTKTPYHTTLRDHVRPGARLLDYGCGIGSDGLALLEAGYDVRFADFDNPSTRYLRWRLDRRGLDAPVLDIEADDLPTDHDAVYAFDVIEHVDDPFAFLDRIEPLAALVVVNLLEEDEHEHHHALHRRLPIPELLARARSRGLVHHAVHHGRSHLVAYRGTGGPLSVVADQGRRQDPTLRR